MCGFVTVVTACSTPACCTVSQQQLAFIKQLQRSQQPGVHIAVRQFSAMHYAGIVSLCASTTCRIHTLREHNSLTAILKVAAQQSMCFAAACCACRALAAATMSAALLRLSYGTSGAKHTQGRCRLVPAAQRNPLHLHGRPLFSLPCLLSAWLPHAYASCALAPATAFTLVACAVTVLHPGSQLGN